MVIAIDAAVPPDAEEQVNEWALDLRVYAAASHQYGTDFDEEMRRYQRFQGLPPPVRSLVMIFWSVVIRIWQIFRR